MREGAGAARSLDSLRREAGAAATLDCSKSRRATEARLAAGGGGGRVWCECELGRVVVDCERCGRSEGLLTVCGRREEEWERTTAGEEGAGADMARLLRKEQREAWLESDAQRALGGGRGAGPGRDTGSSGVAAAGVTARTEAKGGRALHDAAVVMELGSGMDGRAQAVPGCMTARSLRQGQQGGGCRQREQCRQRTACSVERSERRVAGCGEDMDRCTQRCAGSARASRQGHDTHGLRC